MNDWLMCLRSAVATALFLVIATPVLADDLIVSNATDGEIVSLFVSDLGGNTWGQDQLDEPLEPGATMTVRGLDPGMHRVRIIDEDDNECIIDNVPVKAGNTWTVTDDLLDECQAPEEKDKGAALPGAALPGASARPSAAIAPGPSPKEKAMAPVQVHAFGLE